MALPDQTAIFRFAPSPNGALHLGHAFSALINEKMAREIGGKLLLRIEDIDQTRCTPELEAAMLEDLDWLGIPFEKPHRRQSEHFETYRSMLESLRKDGLVYPAFLSRGEIRRAVERFEANGKKWPRDPDGAPLYPGNERDLSDAERARLIDGGAPFAWRLDISRALAGLGRPLSWQEIGQGTVSADPAAWGDVILARRDTPTSYHLSVVADDAAQGVTHVVRGRDLYHATSVHRLLQYLLGLDEPLYHHHELVLAPDGEKLSKSRSDTGLAALRERGVAATEIRLRLGF
jgi:glutamyl-Q tRNA(Asp) synthetase